MAVKKTILNAINEILEYEKGLKTSVRESSLVVNDEVDVKAIRTRLGLSQQKFAQTYAISIATLQNWESGRRRPEVGTRLFLKLVSRDPAFVAKTIREG